MNQPSNLAPVWQGLSPKQQLQVTSLLTQLAVKFILTQVKEAEGSHGVHK